MEAINFAGVRKLLDYQVTSVIRYCINYWLNEPHNVLF